MCQTVPDQRADRRFRLAKISPRGSFLRADTFFLARHNTCAINCICQIEALVMNQEQRIPLRRCASFRDCGSAAMWVSVCEKIFFKGPFTSAKL